jgi:hypothetical protein
VADSYEHGNELSGDIKRGKYLEYLSNYCFLKTDSDPWNCFID